MENQVKKFIITEEQKNLMFLNINSHQLMDAKWILRQLPEFVDQEKEIEELKQENKDLQIEIDNLLEKILGEGK